MSATLAIRAETAYTRLDRLTTPEGTTAMTTTTAAIVDFVTQYTVNAKTLDALLHKFYDEMPKDEPSLESRDWICDQLVRLQIATREFSDLRDYLEDEVFGEYPMPDSKGWVTT
ncbi:hypothetical protein NCPPB3778_64 [Rathayibacter phage NCPPB3778]|nr:hypothetical protein NCPPB3778_64 [Rathayibacter phage NCPPB3778]